MGHGCSADHIVLHIMHDHPVFVGGQICDHMADIVGIKRAGLCSHPAWEIRITDDDDTIVRHNPLIHHSEFAITAFFRGQIYDHRARLHACNHISGPQFGRIAVGNQSCGDHYIHIRRNFAEFGQLGCSKLRR